MKILHTSDWHLGKKIEGKNRLLEQRFALESIAKTANDENVELIIVAGDIFDTYTPSAEAEELFFESLNMLTENGRTVVVLSGNHDDATRLCASHPLARYGGVYFSGESAKNRKGAKLTLGSSGENYYVFSDEAGERLFLATLPYPTEAKLKENSEAESYSARIADYITETLKHNTENLPVILAAHIFMLGGKGGSSERDIELGGARIIGKEVIPNNVIYTALGHLHKRQIVDKDRNILYCGSLLQYAFDEALTEKSVTIFEVKLGAVQNLKTVKIPQLKPLFKIQANSLEQAETILNSLNGYVELEMLLDKPLEGEAQRQFAATHPDVFLKIGFKGEANILFERRSLGDRELFTAFYKEKYGSEPNKELVKLFLDELFKTEVEDETAEA